MNDTQRAAILDEIAQYTARPMLEDDEITVGDLAQRLGISNSAAAGRLIRLVEIGTMTMRSKVYDPRTGKVVNAYKVQSP